jgi:hypothetical protein
MGDLRVRRSPESTAIVPLRKHYVHYMFLFANDLSERGKAAWSYLNIRSDLVAAAT